MIHTNKGVEHGQDRIRTGACEMSDDAILAEIEREGYDAALVGEGLTQVPYKRGTLEFGAWRAGWASGKEYAASSAHAIRACLSGRHTGAT